MDQAREMPGKGLKTMKNTDGEWPHQVIIKRGCANYLNHCPDSLTWIGRNPAEVEFGVQIAVGALFFSP